MLIENNILLDGSLPTEWMGYQINTSFRRGIQLHSLLYDRDIGDYERTQEILYLLFADEDTERLREYPQGEEFTECFLWFLNGWTHDKDNGVKEKQRLIDFDVDQWRIYADFLQIYHIDLSSAQMHWWEFCGLLWNMPGKQSSFLRVLSIRQQNPNNVGKEERKFLIEQKKIYELDQDNRKEFTEEQKSKIDDYDRMMEEIRKKKKQ